MSSVRTRAFLQHLLLIMALLVVVGCQSPGTEMDAENRDAADETTETAADMTAEHTVAEGRFVNKGGQNTDGTYRVVSDDGDLRLVLDSDFRTDEGPDLHVVLSPAHVEDVDSDNATTDDATLIVAQLSGLEGPQQFDLPKELDLSTYNSVLIHCIEFSHLYGAAPVSVD